MMSCIGVCGAGRTQAHPNNVVYGVSKDRYTLNRTTTSLTQLYIKYHILIIVQGRKVLQLKK